MARQHKRKMVWNEDKQRWISPLTGRMLTDEQYKARCAQGRIAAEASKALAAFLQSYELKAEQAAMIGSQNANAGSMRKLPGMSVFQHALHVAWSARRGPADLSITRGGSGNGNDGGRVVYSPSRPR